MSLQYTGSYAQKSELITYGKATLLGKIANTLTSGVRFYNANWTDGPKQDSLDLLFGNVLVDKKLNSKIFEKFENDNANWSMVNQKA